jgi:hypothetical protein
VVENDTCGNANQHGRRQARSTTRTPGFAFHPADRP